MHSVTYRIMNWLGNEPGIKDWCLKCDNLESMSAASGLPSQRMSTAKKFARTKPNGEVAEWLLAASNNLKLPFFIQDLSDASIRIPYGQASVHSNGMSGISRILLNQSLFSTAEIDTIGQLTSRQGSQHSLIEAELATLPTKSSALALVLCGVESETKLLSMSAATEFTLTGLSKSVSD